MYYLKGKRVFLGLLTHPLPFFISPYLHWLGCSIFKQRVLDYCYTNLKLWRNDSELYYNGNMDWNMDISEIISNGTYYFCRCYDYRSGY